MNQARQAVRQDPRDAPRDAKVTMAEGKPGRTLVAPLNRVSYTGLEKPLEAYAADLSVSAAASLSAHSNYFTVDLAVLKEIAQELAELFGLTLPVAFKKQVHLIR
jgi:hypothetical protein